MKYLFDTHLLLWLAAGSPRLSQDCLIIVNNPNNALYFSAASIWEVAIKQNLKQDDFNFNASVLRRGLFDNGYEELPIKGEHALAIAQLQDFHKDPFDRMLVAQANVEGITLLTADDKVAQYKGLVHLV